MYSPMRGNQISGGVFLIGLGLCFLFNFWWPGIMFVIGAAAIAQGLSEGRGWYAMQGGLWLIGIGLVFSLGFNLPLLLILIGASMLLGRYFRPPFMQKSSFNVGQEKRKNDESFANDADEVQDDEDNEHCTLGDDGEMVKVKNDQKR